MECCQVCVHGKTFCKIAYEEHFSKFYAFLEFAVKNGN